jgi:hypothetical protein
MVSLHLPPESMLLNKVLNLDFTSVESFENHHLSAHLCLVSGCSIVHQSVKS